MNFNKFKSKSRIFRYDPDFPLRAIRERQGMTVSHGHEYCECVFIIKGRGMHQSASNDPVPIRRGDVLVIPRGGWHAYTQSDELELLNLMFDGSLLPPVRMELYANPVYKRIFLQSRRRTGENHPMTHLKEREFRKVETLLHYLAQEGTSTGKHGYKLGLYMAVLSRLCEVWEVPEEEPAMPLDIPGLTAYLEEHFLQKLYLEDLAKHAGMSRTSLERYFQAALGVTPMIYLRNLRLRHAAELLVNTDFSLKEIADQSGFTSMPYFFRAFRSCYGVPPMEYRTAKAASSAKKGQKPGA
ncbi:MAG: helix-turn-helix domain-containing protein [Lentisphaeria bacterium]|nr:helix-turn-helix domain-containing protein [Lentisphaeria bacterium]